MKDRPCAVIMIVTDKDDNQMVTVLPVTHSLPSDPSQAVEIPYATKERLGLDAERSWVVMTEANRFIWPGPDIRMRRTGDAASVAYGLLPRALLKEIAKRFADAIEEQLAGIVSRSD